MILPIVKGQTSFTLQESIDYALEHNRMLKTKKLDLDDAQQDIKNVLSAALPQISAGIDYTYYFATPAQPIPDFITPAIYGVLFSEDLLKERDLGPPNVNELSFFQPHNLTGKVDMSFLIYDGSYNYGVKASKLYKELTRKQIDATAFEVRSTITKAYLSCLIVDENIKILEKNIGVISKSLNETKAMFKEGFLESLDVDRLQLTFDNLNTEYTNLKELSKLNVNLLQFQMGYDNDQEITLTDQLDDLVAEDIEMLITQTQVNYGDRPEYELLNMSEKLNELDYKRHRAGYLPSVRAIASAQQSLQRSNLFDNDEADWIPTALAGVSINIPIYDGGMKRSNIQKAKINASRIAMQKEEFESGIDLEVKNAQIALINANNNLRYRKSALDVNDSIYKRVNIKFVEGIGSSIEMNQAESSLFQAQGEYINALYEVVNAKADLQIALGKI